MAERIMAVMVVAVVWFYAGYKLGRLYEYFCPTDDDDSPNDF